MLTVPRLLRPVLVLLVLVASAPRGHGQTGKRVTSQSLGWFAYFYTVKVNDRWSFGGDAQSRNFLGPGAPHQIVVRGHVIRELGSGWDVRAGGCGFLHWPNYPTAEGGLIVPELRPHVEFDHAQRSGRLRVSHRYRAEARFFHNVQEGELAEGYSFTNLRFRYQLALELPILRARTAGVDRLYLKVADELFLNAGSNVVLNTFDHNRIYGGLVYWTSTRFALELGYLHWFQQQASGTDYFSRNIVRVGAVHRFDLSKKRQVPVD